MSHNDERYVTLAEELSEGCKLLKELSENNYEKFNAFMNTQFRFLHNEGVFATKEECITALKNFKMMNTIGIGQYVKLYEDFAEHLKTFALISSYNLDATPLNKMHTAFFDNRCSEKYWHPFFFAICNKMQIDGKNPVKWYAENKPESFKQLLKTYEDIREETLRIESDNIPVMHKPYTISAIDAALLSSDIDLTEYNPSLAAQISPEYEHLLAGCDKLFDDNDLEQLAKPAELSQETLAAHDELHVVHDAAFDDNNNPESVYMKGTLPGDCISIDSGEINPEEGNFLAHQALDCAV